MGELAAPAPGLTALQTFLDANPTIDFIQCLFIDYSAAPRTRVVTKHFALSLAAKSSPVSIQSPLLAAIVLDDSLLIEDIEIGDDELWPDWATLRVLPHQPAHAQVMTFHKENGIWDGKGFRRCPRSRLQELTKDAKTKHNMEFLVGLEIEFYLMEALGDVVPVGPLKTHAGLFSTASLRGKHLPVLEEIVRTLSKVGILVRQFHSEGAPGFFEISTEPMAPLQAADALIYSQEAIRTISFNHGFHATMYPKPFEKCQGVGSHLHLSISKPEREESFLAGILESWAALAAFYMPTYDSYARVQPGQLVFWSRGNKSAAIRKVRSGHWELRGNDATSNPYLVLLAILTAGMLAVESDKVLEMKDPVKIMWKGIEGEKALDLTKLDEYGIKDKFAKTLKEALELLKKDERLTKALGPEILDRYFKLKTKEEQKFSEMTRAERMEKLVRVF